jgi:hypothetical protein
MACQYISQYLWHRTTPSLPLLPLVLQLHQGNNSLSWGLVTFTVDSDEDLSAMRKALADQVSFFEADLAGFTTIRGYQEAAALASQAPSDAKTAGFNIPYRVLRELPARAANYVSDPFESDWTTSVHAEVGQIPCVYVKQHFIWHAMSSTVCPSSSGSSSDNPQGLCVHWCVNNRRTKSAQHSYCL